MSEERTYFGIVAVFAAAVAGLALIVADMRLDIIDLGVGQERLVTTSRPSTPALQSAGGSSELTPRGSADALSPDTSMVPAEAAGTHGAGLSSSAAVACLLADLEVSFQPTPEGLFARTTELWSQEAFLNLSRERIEQLIELEPWMTAPTTLLGFIGSDLPTLEDCRRGLDDPETLRLFEALIVAEATFSELCETPVTERTKTKLALIRSLKVQRDDAELKLMERLDRTTSYQNWRLLARLYMAWEQ